MKYMGSKRLLAKHLLPIILKDREPDQWYVEPFVGGGNMIDKVDGKRLGADANEYTIAALKLIRDDLSRLPTGEKNGSTSEIAYRYIKGASHIHKGIKGYYGFALSYGGKWFGGWCRNSSRTRDYVAEAYRNAIKQSPYLQGVELVHCSYKDLTLPRNSIVYCDPPYAAKLGYSKSFDHGLFWQWCRDKSNEGHSVFVSEYTAPSDFVCIWRKRVASSLDQATGGEKKKESERLFRYETNSTLRLVHGPRSRRPNRTRLSSR